MSTAKVTNLHLSLCLAVITRNFFQLMFYLQIHLIALIFNGREQMSIIRLWKFYSREKIGSNTVKERKIMSKKLGKININNGSQHQNIFVLIRISQLKKHTLYNECFYRVFKHLNIISFLLEEHMKQNGSGEIELTAC